MISQSNLIENNTFLLKAKHFPNKKFNLFVNLLKQSLYNFNKSNFY